MERSDARQSVVDRLAMVATSLRKTLSFVKVCRLRKTAQFCRLG